MSCRFVKYLVLFAHVSLFLIAIPCYSVDFRYQYNNGDEFRYYGTGEQSVYYDGKLIQSNSNSFRSAYKIVSEENGSGRINVESIYSNRSFDQHAAMNGSETEELSYNRDDLGHEVISSSTGAPVLRNVPCFSGNDITEGQSWTEDGQELEDFSSISFLKQDNRTVPPILVTFPVSYRYEGDIQKDGRDLSAISIDYNLFYKDTNGGNGFRVYCTFISGTYHRDSCFDQQLGLENSYTDKYDLVLTLSNGHTLEFTGSGTAELAEAKIMDRPSVATTIKDELEKTGLGDLEVTASGGGVKILLDSITFPANSDQLQDSEKQKLDKVAEVLKEYPDRDLLIEGFTAKSGSEVEQRRLSEMRAASVGEYLLSLEIRKPNQIIYRGLGASRPIDSNDDEAGMKKNRRVEITLLEN